MSETRLSRVTTEPLEANYIPSLHQATQQVLWIGCSDSDLRESCVFNLLGGELLVLRNIGNMIIDGDLSSETAIKHAVVDLQVAIDLEQLHNSLRPLWVWHRESSFKRWVKWSVVVVSDLSLPKIFTWSLINGHYSKLNSLYAAHEEDINKAPVIERDRCFVELNILDQLRSLRKFTEVTDAIRKRHLQIHGLVYDTKADKAYRVLEGLRNSQHMA
ncbi:hypothetical protein N7478_012337 [Penicillium angulare]|uniref:uncharacterized protein n=1 Tax=Penicillium angulare TaxID=116970 RepID=UPI0025426085|nr:uncharacterized protein N7478_012337 [Penicillium angulare]KAJ5259356.1 hypothetical protein N7478_012337 [Penicillium angulare]